MNKLYFTFLFTFSIVVLFSQDKTYDNWLQEGDPNEWVAERIENANKGIKEIVKMPLVVRFTGWGCLCPDYYMGISPFTQEGPWIEPIASKKFPSTSFDGHSLIVKGYFTGKMIPIDFNPYYALENLLQSKTTAKSNASLCFLI